MFGEQVSGKIRYFNYGLFTFIGTLYWFFFRIFTLYFILKIDFQWYEIFPYVLLVLLMAYFFWIGPLQKKEKAQSKASAIDFMDALIKKGKGRPHSLMLGFEDVIELDMKFDDDKSLKEKLNSLWYRHYLKILVLKEIENYEEQYLTVPEGLNKLLDNLEKSIKEMEYVPEISENSSMEQDLLEETKELEEEINSMNPTETVLIEENLSKDAIMKKTHQLEEEVRSIIAPNDTKKESKILPFERFDLEKARTIETFKEGIDCLKELKFYYVGLYAKENFEGEKEEFEQLFIILPGDYKTILDTHKEMSELDEWPVNIKMCYTYWTYWWLVAKGLPVLFLNFSDNMIKPDLSTLTKMNAQVMAYLELKVMDLWMNDLTVRPEYTNKENVYLRAVADTFERGFSDIIQDQADKDIKYAKFLQDKAQSQLFAKIEKYKRTIILLLCLLIFVFIIGGIVLSFLI